MTTATGTTVPPTGLRREIGALGVAALTFNIVMGSGMFVIPATMGVLGAWAPAVIALCAFVMGAVTLCFAEASSRMPRAGGVYSVTHEALGPAAGGVVGGMIWLSSSLAASGMLAAAIDQVAPFVPWMGGTVGRPVAIIATCLAFMWIPSRGARQSAWASELTTAIKVAPLLVFIGLAAMSPAAPAVPTAMPTLAVLAPLMVLGIYLCAGVESGMVMNGEVRDPVRALPRGLGGALLVYSALAVAVQLAAARALGAGLSASRAPLVDGAMRLAPSLAPVMAAGAIIAMLGSAAGLASTTPRMMYALAQDGLMPRLLARLHPVRRTPNTGIVVHGLIVATLAIIGEYTPLAIAASLASMAVYVLGCTAALALRRRGVAEAGQVVAWRLTPIAAAIGIGANLAIILGAPREQSLALLVASLVFAGIATARARTEAA